MKTKTQPKGNLIPVIINKENIKRKIANKKEFTNIGMKQYKYTHAKITINEMKKKIQETVKKMVDMGYDVNVNITMDTPIGPRSGRQTYNNTKLDLWMPTWGTNDDPTDQDEIVEWYDDGKGIIDNFEVFVQYTKADKKKGGIDENNDCLYECLYKLLRDKLKAKWEHARNLKKSLNLKRDAMINTDGHIDKIEKWLNVGIFLEGDDNRTPKGNYKTSINIIFENQHFSVKDTKPKITTMKYEKKVAFIYYDYYAKTYNVYDENGLYTVPKDEHVYKNSHWYFKSRKETLQSNYDEWIVNAEKLKSITRGKINLYKSGKIKTASLKLFYDLIQHVDEPDDICDNEAQFILNCYRGGLLFAEPYKGKAYKADVCSLYPSIMLSKNTIPYKKGEFIHLTQSEMNSWKDKHNNQYFKMGIYRIEITGEHRLFKFNEKNYYTNIDIKLANKLQLNIKLIEDGEANFLYYPQSSCIQYQQLFKNFVNYLFDIKKNNPDVIYAKRLLNILWGALSENRVSNTYVDDGTKDMILDEDEHIETIKKLDENTYKYECRKTSHYFESGFARLMPFMTATGRETIVNLAIDHVKDLNNIYRVHTDSFITSEPLTHLKNKQDCYIGMLGYEGYCKKCEITNMRKPKGDFII